MMDTKRLAAWTAILLASSSPSAAADVGIIRLNPEGQHYLYSRHKIVSGEQIMIQTPAPNEDRACCMAITVDAGRSPIRDPDASEYPSDRKLFRYKIKPPSGIKAELPFMGIAVIGKRLDLQQLSNTTIRIGGDAHASEVSMCTSREGVHVVHKAGEEVLGHLYYYLGYDIENPSCPASQ